ncbi:MAG TPA: YhgE/Pip family protein [Friedmanniella sp.]
MITLERADGSRRVGLWSLVGLLLVPLVLAGGFLATTWKSADRLDRVQAAVVNLDQPVKIGKQTVPLGRQLAGGLVDGASGSGDQKSDTNFAWVLTDAADASDGLGSGRYAAVVTIPENFSARATSYSDQSGDTATQALLGVQTSAVSGVSDPVIGQAITAAATRALNSELTEQYVKNIYLGFNTTQKQFTKVADAADQLSGGTAKLADGLRQTSSGTAQLSDGLGRLDDGGGQLATGAKKLSHGLDQYAAGVSTLAEKTAALPKGGRQLADGAQQAADGVDQLADGGAGLVTGLKTYRSTLEAQADEIKLPQEQRQAVAACLKDPTSDPTCSLILLGYQAGAKQSLDGAANGLTQKDPKSGQSLLSGATALAGGQKQAAKGLHKLADGTDRLADGLKPLAAGIRQLDGGAAELASGAGDLSTGIGQYTSGVHGVAAGAGRLSSGLVQLSSGADKLADGTQQLADGLAKGAKQIPTYDTNARDRLSTVVATPVTTPDVTSVFSNVATTTLLAVLALWVGGLASFLVLRAVSARALSSMRSSARLTLESLLPAAVVAVVQAVVLTVLLARLLDLGGGATARFLGLALLAGLVFAALNQALVGWFGGAGRFVSVVLVVLTAATAITSAVPEVFDSVTPLLPLTPALQGMRAVASGAGSGGAAAALLVAWLVVGLAAGVLATARRRTVRALALVPAAIR